MCSKTVIGHDLYAFMAPVSVTVSVSLLREGLGTKEHILIDFVLTHSNEQIAAIKEAWEAKVRTVAIGLNINIVRYDILESQDLIPAGDDAHLA